MKIECPNCGSKARMAGMATRTLMYFPTVYDENGRIISRDGNTTTTSWTCSKCGTVYTTKSRYGEVEEIK